MVMMDRGFEQGSLETANRHEIETEQIKRRIGQMFNDSILQIWFR